MPLQPFLFALCVKVAGNTTWRADDISHELMICSTTQSSMEEVINKEMNRLKGYGILQNLQRRNEQAKEALSAAFHIKDEDQSGPAHPSYLSLIHI